MNRDAFLQVSDILPYPLLLVSGDGTVLAANASFFDKVYPHRQKIIDSPLGDVVTAASADLAAFIRNCARSRSSVPGTVSFRETGKTWRLNGALLCARSENQQALVLLCFESASAALGQFRLLNEKIDALNREIQRRNSVEAELREQRDLAHFGRDIGMVLSRSSYLPETLQSCAELMVKYLDAAFARIWTLDEQKNVLILRASAGMYTHLDGAHSRIPLGKFKIGMIASEKKPHLTNAVIGDERVNDQDWARKEGMVAFAGYPLCVDDRTVGVMAIFARQPLNQATLDAMASVALGIALGIERKRIERALREQTEVLRRADQRKDEFLAMLAHELRNPLAPIRSGIELLQHSVEDQETLAMMHEHIEHIVRLVDDLLDVSRIMRGRIDLRKESVRLEDIVSKATKTVQPLVEKHRHQFTIRQAQQAVWLDADPVRMSQVLCNLLNNAIKYTPDGGHIWLETALESGTAIIRVRDNGMGISADFLPELFDLFSQSQRSLARSQGGLGIGLTLAQKLIRMHGGQISAASAGAGTGSEFCISLPLAAAKEPAAAIAAAPQKAPAPAAGDLRILVVDDSMDSARTLQKLLNAMGYPSVELAFDGHEAVTKAGQYRPQVVFLDLGLPGIDGFEVAARLRARPDFSTAMLVALTGYGSADDRRKSRDAGFDRHLVKPVGMAQLLDVLATAGQNE